MEDYETLEKRWAHWNGLDSEGMVVCSSGTAALHLALEALRLPPGSQVVVPDFAMIACARAVTLAGLTPLFIDCDGQLLADWELIGKMDETSPVPTHCQRRNVAALMLVHTYGRRCSFPAWDDGGTPFKDGPYHFIEDLAEAHGVKPYPQTDAACWSFYRNKIVAGEEGGAVWFSNPENAAHARSLRSLGFIHHPRNLDTGISYHDHIHTPRGHNYRLANALARLILKSLDRVAVHQSARRIVEEWYDWHCPAEWRQPHRDAVWVYDVRIPGLTHPQQVTVVKALQAAGIAARHGFYPLSLQEEYAGARRLTAAGDQPSQAFRASAEVFYLPVEPYRTTKDNSARAFDVIRGALSRDRT